MLAYVRKVIADVQGQFDFSDIPYSEYFVATSFERESAIVYEGRLEKQGGVNRKRGIVRDGALTESC